MEGWQPLWLRGVLYGKQSFGGRRLVRCVQLKLGRNRLCLIEKVLMLFSKQGVPKSPAARGQGFRCLLFVIMLFVVYQPTFRPFNWHIGYFQQSHQSCINFGRDAVSIRAVT
jgi:hypothetical protein